MMKKIFSAVLFAGTLLTISAIEPGGRIRIEDLRSRSEHVAGPENETEKAKASTEIMLFFDASSRDTPAFLRMFDDLANRNAELPEKEQISVFALSRNSKRATRDALDGASFVYPVRADEKRLLFQEYAAGDLLLPFALIVRGGEVLWKGSPMDVENILNLMKQDKFDATSQVKIERIRREMQMAVQSSLPDVILRCADDILKLQPGDALAVQAKLFVLENTNRFPEALEFTKRNAAANPGDMQSALLYLDFLIRAGKPGEFRTVYTETAKNFHSSPDALSRLLAFSAGSVPFGWLPPGDAARVADEVLAAWSKTPSARLGTAYMNAARICHLLGNLQGASDAQENAVKLIRGKKAEEEARRLLDYYRELLALQKK